MSSPIRFFNDDVSYRIRDKRKISAWLQDVAKKEGRQITDLNIVFCSDNQLLKINKQHLNHDFFTDIITFDYSSQSEILGEIYISIDRVKDNARSLTHSTINELHRVLVHGVLHLSGYKDKSDSEKVVMRNKEDQYLESRSF